MATACQAPVKQTDRLRMMKGSMMRIRQVLKAAGKYLTNHVITWIPSHTLRHAWYAHVLGWSIAPDATILMASTSSWPTCIQVDGRCPSEDGR
jgi:hypothetical protein